MPKEATKKRRQRKRRSSRSVLSSGLLELVPILFVVAIVPLVVRLKVIPLEGIALEYWIGDSGLDFFSYYKAVLLVLATFTAIAFFVKGYLDGRIPLKPVRANYYLGLFALFVLLSTLLAEHKSTAWFGFTERHEGCIVLLAYVALAFMTIHLVQNERHVNAVLFALVLSATTAGLIGVFQYFGADLFQTDLGRALILSEEQRRLGADLTFNFDEHAIYSTFYNTNYVGSYAAMLLPLSVVLVFITDGRRAIGAILFSCLMFAVLIGSNSRAGLVGTLAAIVIISPFLARRAFERWRSFAALATGATIIFMTMNYASGGKPWGQIKSFFESRPATSVDASPDNLILADIVLGDETLRLLFDNGQALVFIHTGDRLLTRDEAGRELNFEWDDEEERHLFQSPPFQQYGFQIRDRFLIVHKEDLELAFTLVEGSFHFVNNRGEPVQFEPVKTIGFSGLERLGSNRGYIWSRSLPMLADTVILGRGPDCFPFYFPQDEYLAKILYYSDGPFTLIDKPHSKYLQIAISTGIVSLLLLLALFGSFLFRGFVTAARKGLDGFYSSHSLAILAGIVGYLTAAFFNDSVVSVAPVFWVLLGLGIGCNWLGAVEKEAKQ